MDTITYLVSNTHFWDHNYSRFCVTFAPLQLVVVAEISLFSVTYSIIYACENLGLNLKNFFITLSIHG